MAITIRSQAAALDSDRTGPAPPAIMAICGGGNQQFSTDDGNGGASSRQGAGSMRGTAKRADSYGCATLHP